MNDSAPMTAWRIAEKNRVCFLACGGHQVPMAPIVRKDEGVIYFLSSVNSEKLTEIEKNPSVQITFSDHAANDYLFIAGSAQISNDREKIKEIWTPFAKAWWDSAEDPDIRIIVVSPDNAEYWDGPNSLTGAAKMLFAAVTGNKPDMGENRITGM